MIIGSIGWELNEPTPMKYFNQLLFRSTIVKSYDEQKIGTSKNIGGVRVSRETFNSFLLNGINV